jgi:hypothetical protein
VLKKKDPEQFFLRFCQQAVRCAPKQPRIKKNFHAKRKTDQLHTSARETISQLPIPTKFIPLLPSCERLRLELVSKINTLPELEESLQGLKPVGFTCLTPGLKPRPPKGRELRPAMKPQVKHLLISDLKEVRPLILAPTWPLTQKVLCLQCWSRSSTS